MGLHTMTPDFIRHCYEAVLVRTVVEYQHALSLLQNVPSARYESLKQQIATAISLIEQELERRQLEEHRLAA